MDEYADITRLLEQARDGAEVGVSEATVKRDWALARAFLKREVQQAG